MRLTEEIAEVARSIFARRDSEPGDGFDAQLWRLVDQAGLTRVSTPEPIGSGGTMGDSAAVVVEAGAQAVALPLVETDLLAGWLAAAVGISLPDGPLTAVRAELVVDRREDHLLVSGVLPRVGWARDVAALVVLTPKLVLVVDRSAGRIRAGRNLAGEPRDEVRLDGVRLGSDRVASAPAGAWEEFELRAALGRAMLLAGASRAAIAVSVEWARMRTQFGRPIGAFQAIQQQLAIAAAEVAAAEAAVDGALGAIEAAGGISGAAVPIAIAKARTSESATVVARCAHQVHGAIGMTYEHHLRLLTTRLWAWRDEDGSESYWNKRIGRAFLTLEPGGLWPAISRSGKGLALA